MNCAPVCETCKYMDENYRCPPLTDEESKTNPLNSLQPGDLNKLFERIVTHDYYKQYQPTILSMPLSNSTRGMSVSGSAGQFILDDGVIDGPWIVVLENFLTDDECNALIEHGERVGYQPSTSLRQGRYVRCGFCQIALLASVDLCFGSIHLQKAPVWFHASVYIMKLMTFSMCL